MKKAIPTYEFIIDDSIESGVKAVSIVVDPAFGTNLVAFAKDKPRFIELKDNKRKQICAGFAILANVPVYRYDEEIGEYYGFFSPETIEKIVEKYHEEMNSNRVNLDHNSNEFIDAYLVEDYIVNSEARIQDLKAMGLEHPNAMGSWYTAFKIKDPQVFDSIINAKDATSNVGFSIEAFLDRVMVNMNNAVKNNYINSKLNKEKMKVSKTLKDRILAIFTELEKFTRVLVPELAFEIEYDEVGAPVGKVTVDENGVETLSPVGAGEFVTDLGIIVVDESSNLIEVRDLPAEPTEPVVEEPEAPIEGTDPVEPLVEEPIVEPVEPITEPVVEEPVVEPSNDLNKTLAELCPSAGEYAIEVTVDANGIITSAVVSSQKDLIPVAEEGGFSKQVKSLYSRVQELENKMKDPITDPILTPEPVVVDFNKMSQYEKLMYKKGLKPV